MNRSCDKCGMEFHRANINERMLFLDMEVSGWHVTSAKAVCPACLHSKWKPDSSECPKCGDPVFAAVHMGRMVNFDAVPHHCGYEINYGTSRAQKVRMDKCYWGMDAVDKPKLLFRQHRCKSTDIARKRSREMDGWYVAGVAVNPAVTHGIPPVTSWNQNITFSSGTMYYTSAPGPLTIRGNDTSKP